MSDTPNEAVAQENTTEQVYKDPRVDEVIEEISLLKAQNQELSSENEDLRQAVLSSEPAPGHKEPDLSGLDLLNLPDDKLETMSQREILLEQRKYMDSLISPVIKKNEELSEVTTKSLSDVRAKHEVTSLITEFGKDRVLEHEGIAPLMVGLRQSNPNLPIKDLFLKAESMLKLKSQEATPETPSNTNDTPIQTERPNSPSATVAISGDKKMTKQEASEAAWESSGLSKRFGN